MAAGLGFKDFVTGEVLTAADVDGYLMQGVWVFASAAARDSVVTSPQEGNFAYLKDTNVTTYYTGSAWANLDTTGMTNPMTTTGDIIYSSPGSTPVRLGIGTANQVLRVNSGATAPEWATPASGGGMTLISTTALTGSTVSLTSIAGTYTDLIILLQNVYCSGTNELGLRFNSDTTTSNYMYSALRFYNPGGSTQYITEYGTTSYVTAGVSGSSSTVNQNLQTYLRLPRYATTATKSVFGTSASQSGSNQNLYTIQGSYYGGSAISQIDIITTSGTFSGGTAYLYGVN
jgi:hypothetical protein